MAETFSTVPQYVWEITNDYNVLVTTFESGKEQRKYLGVNPRQWKLSFVGNWTTVSVVQSFFVARKGGFEAFNWTPPGEETAISVRFAENSLSIQRHGLTGFSECQVTLMEVL